MADDRDLGFVEAVADAFSFLVDRYGFEMKTPAPTLVEFGSPAVLLRVYHGRQSYEINVELNLQTEWKQGVAPFTISDVLRVGGASHELPNGVIQASTRTAVRSGVQRLSDLLRKYGLDAIAGNPFAYRRLATERSRAAVAEAEALRLRDLRRKAETAWRNRDFRTVEQAYSQMEEALTPAEKKKLEYVRRQPRYPKPL